VSISENLFFRAKDFCRTMHKAKQTGSGALCGLLSKIHLPLNCGEFSFRWIHRKVSDSERRDAAYQQAPGKRLSIKQLRNLPRFLWAKTANKVQLQFPLTAATHAVK
jgi:hypothetical protein